MSVSSRLVRRILLFTLLLAPSLPSGSAQALLPDLDALLAATHAAGALDGTVLVADGDDVIYERGFGLADRVGEVPNTPETRFRIASVTKPFTAALVMQLVEEGALDLDAPVSRDLPDVPAPTNTVTVHQLLSHTGGVPEHVGRPGFPEDLGAAVSPEALLALFAGEPLDFEPGAEHRYSNSGYVLLGLLIEHATGQSYADAVQTRLLDPLGLADTSPGVPTERAAVGYTRSGDVLTPAPLVDPSIPYAAGMLSSTARDLHRWTRALHAGAPFQKPETLTRMLTPVMNGYAYGIGVSALPIGDATVAAVGHDGDLPGFSSFLVYLPETERTIVVLDNTQGDVRAVALGIVRLLAGETVEPPKPPISGALRAWIGADGIEAATARYRAARDADTALYDFDEEHLNALGYSYLQSGDAETAVAVFALNVESFPEAWNPHDSLGEAYAEAGDADRAIASYRRALALNPAAESARDALARLGADVPDAEALALPTAMLERYVGEYAIQPGLTITVTLADGVLRGQPTGRSPVDLVPVSGHRFTAPGVGATVVFEIGADGRAERLTLVADGREMRGMRVE